MKLRSIAVSLLLAVASGVALADADARGCADHPLFTRMSGFSIFQCKKTYDQLGINIDTNPKSASNLKPEGDLTSIGYIFKKSPEQPSPPSDLQVMRNYQNAAKQKGGEVLVDRWVEDRPVNALHRVRADADGRQVLLLLSAG